MKRLHCLKSEKIYIKVYRDRVKPDIINQCFFKHPKKISTPAANQIKRAIINFCESHEVYSLIDNGKTLDFEVTYNEFEIKRINQKTMNCTFGISQPINSSSGKKLVFIAAM